MRSLVSIMFVGVIFGGMVWADRVEAGDKNHGNRRADIRREHRDDRYLRGSDVAVIRDYYSAAHRPLPPGLRLRYHRAGYLPPGWARRMRPVPVRLERQLVVVPRGYRRGIIDDHVVVYNDRGFILNVAFLF
jgi:hypothetical protein